MTVGGVAIAGVIMVACMVAIPVTGPVAGGLRNGRLQLPVLIINT